MDAFSSASATAAEGSWLEMCYEDIIVNPRDSLTRLLQHCGLELTEPFDRGLARRHFSAGRTAAYGKDLSTADVRQLDRSLGWHLRRHGYPVG